MSDGSGCVVIALGGNAIAPRGTAGTAEQQHAQIGKAMASVARLVADGGRVVLTHGNGPQVGNLLTKNLLARDVVPPMPIHWCVAQTQGTIAYAMVNALEAELAARGASRLVIPLVSRVLVRGDDPAWLRPNKPIGRYVSEAEADDMRRRFPDQSWNPSPAGWRRVVPSPEPVESLDLPAIAALLDLGAVVIANGGGGIPVVRGPDGDLQGVEAVIDKDLSAARLAIELDADHLAILTDVPGVAVDYGGPNERWLDAVDTAELRQIQQRGTFGEGSMGPKVEAVLRFVEATGRDATVGALERATDALRGQHGTRVVAPGRLGVGS